MANRRAKRKFVRFEPSARLQGLLGRELISSDYVALAEAVRNSYDAGAKQITLSLRPKDPQQIVVLDNGSGMSLPEFEKLWMRPGYSEKTSPPKPGARTPLGEKGIGRFAIDKLSKKLVVTTKKPADVNALHAEFNWTQFEDQKKKLRDIKIRVERVYDEELIRQKKGTRLELLHLRQVWTQKDWKGLRAELKKLILPTRRAVDFAIVANAAGWESGQIEPDFDPNGSYHFVFTINKTGNVVWSLSRPTKIIDQLKEQGHRVRGIESGTNKVANSFGFVAGHFYYFSKPNQIKKQGYDLGIGIYRDGFRVEPYGRGDDDWLGVKSLRARRQGHAPISPSKLFGFVEISRDKNPKLRDLTNREGLQDAPEFDQFKDVIFKCFDSFAAFIADDKSKLPEPATIAGQRRSGRGKTRAQAFGELADQLAHQLRQPMSIINTDVSSLSRYLTRKYEDQQINTYVERIQRNVSRLDKNIESLSELARHLKTPTSEIDLAELVSRLVTAHRPNYQQHNLELTFETELENAVVKFSKPAIQFALENYLTNALTATVSGNSRSKSAVEVRLMKFRGNKLRIAVEDGGDGIPTSQQTILFTKPVKSITGSGIGLYYSKLHIESFGGSVGYEPMKDGTRFFIEIPENGEAAS